MAQNRHTSIGIKQAIRLEWLEEAVSLLAAGLDAKEIRCKMEVSVANTMGSGKHEVRSEQTRNFVVTNILKTWVMPDPSLIRFRDAALECISLYPSTSIVLHWSMISASYPFWFNVATQIGRLLSLQETVTQSQIIARLKEHYGDRQTVQRYAQYVIQSFIEWHLLEKHEDGGYKKSSMVSIYNEYVMSLLVESMLYAEAKDRMAVTSLLHHPALFPFYLPSIANKMIVQHNKRLELIVYGLHDDFLGLL